LAGCAALARSESRLHASEVATTPGMLRRSSSVDIRTDLIAGRD
jgi:hypothetical protein